MSWFVAIVVAGILQIGQRPFPNDSALQLTMSVPLNSNFKLAAKEDELQIGTASAWHYWRRAL